MKRIKKLASLLLAVIMVLAMTMTAVAADTESSTIPETEETESSTAPETEETPQNTSTTVETPTLRSGNYQIYQIFTGTYDNESNRLSDVKWGVNGRDYAVDEDGNIAEVSDEILDELTALSDLTDPQKLAVIKEYANLQSTPLGIEPTTNGSTVEYTGLVSGYYLVMGTVTYVYSNGDTQTAETLYVVNVVGNTLTFNPKVGVPAVDKKIVEGNAKVDTNEASIGDDVTYEITGTMPSNIDLYNTYTYLFTDNLSKGLTFKNDITVKVDGVDVTTYFGKEVTTTSDGTAIKVGIEDIKRLSNLPNVQITADTKVVVTYTATLNTNAVIAGTGNPNDVKLNYSNNPNNSGEGNTTPPPTNPDVPTPPEGVTPTKEVVTYTTELAILKTDEDGEILTGAQFTLTGDGVKVSLVATESFESDTQGAYWKLKNGSYTTIAPVTEPADKNNEDAYDQDAGKFKLVRTITQENDPTKAVATIDADGRVTFTGLGAGTYTIEETATPAGYNTIKPITFTVSFDPETKEFSATSATNDISLGVNNTLETTIINKRGSLLPSTGGIGTTIFYVVGGILVIGAGILLVAKKRMNANK